MTTYPLATLAAKVTASGITAPPYSDIYLSLQATFKNIYGVDSYIAPDSQDGQLLAAFAKAMDDANKMAISVYNQFSPLTAVGVGLSSVVKLNGLRRSIPTNSQVNTTLVGVVGTVITNGVVKDTNGKLWNLPASVTIPPAGFVVATATAQEAGAIAATPGQVNSIQTPTLGWQSVTNSSAATPGEPVEEDPELRQRQARSVALPSLTVLEALVGAIELLPGVLQVRAYENDTDTTDANGLPEHSVSMVVLGGSATDIAETIADKKTPGTNTYGTTSVPVTDAIGITHTINFFIPVQKTIKVVVSLHPLTAGYSSTIGDQVKQALVDYINALTAGDDVYRDRLFLPAQLYGAANSLTFNVTNIQINIDPGTPGTSDLVIAFNQIAVTTLVDITLVLV